MIKGTAIEVDEVMVSFDVKSLFTSVQTKDAANAIEELLSEDTMMEERRREGSRILFVCDGIPV